MTNNQAANVMAQMGTEQLMNYVWAYQSANGHLNGVLAYLQGSFNMSLEVAEAVLYEYLRTLSSRAPVAGSEE